MNVSGTDINLKEIYWDKRVNAYTIKVEWDRNSNPKLNSFGELNSGIGGWNTNPKNGEGNLFISNSATNNGEINFEIKDPIFVYTKEFRVPLNLD